MKRRQFTVMAVALMLLAVVAYSQTNGQPERFTANAVSCGSCLYGNLFLQFGNEQLELPVTDERRSGDLGKPPFDVGPLICLARVGVTLGEIAGVAGQHAVAPAVRTPLCERDEMVDAGLDLAARLYPGESNVAVGASSAPIVVAALVDHVGH